MAFDARPSPGWEKHVRFSQVARLYLWVQPYGQSFLGYKLDRDKC